MKIGLQIPSFTWPGGEAEIHSHLRAVARTAEAAAFSSIWVMDHFFQIEYVGETDEPMLESYSTLSYLAALTQRVRLGTLVTGVVYRHPGILVKTVSTLDVLSNGRAYLGIGAAWFEREARGLGVPFPSTRERFERLEETLQIALQMWAGETAPYRGRHHHLAEPLSRPRPIQKPHPPILIGGMGEKKTLRLAARYADACNLFAFSGPEVIRHKLGVLRKYCEEYKRDYAGIYKTALGAVKLGPGGMTTRQVIELCRSLAAAGVEELIVSFDDVSSLKPLELFGSEVIPAAREF